MAHLYAQWLYHHTPGWVPTGSLFFLTVCCQRRNVNSLAYPEIHQCLVKSIEIYEAQRRLYPLILVCMPDHLHMISAFYRDAGMPRVIGDLKRFIARRHGIEWQQGFFEHRLRDQGQLSEKWEYCEANPVKKGLVSMPEEWPYIWRRSTP